MTWCCATALCAPFINALSYDELKLSDIKSCKVDWADLTKADCEEIFTIRNNVTDKAKHEEEVKKCDYYAQDENGNFVRSMIETCVSFFSRKAVK